MSERNFDDWIDTYSLYTSNTEAPSAFHRWTAVATIASAVQRKVYIDMKTFEWVPNFYIILVGPAGFVNKSTSLRLGEVLLRGLGKKMKFGSNSGSWQAMAKEIADSAMQIPGGIKSCSISYFISELGTFLDPQNREQVDFFVDAWDSQRTNFIRNTKSGGKIEIQCPCVNILTGTTPTWIKENFTSTMIGGGFVSRLIFVRGAEKRKLIAYPGLEKGAGDFDHLRHQLMEDLVKISTLEGPMTLTEEAVEWGKNWYMEHHTKKRQLSGERFDGFYARKQTTLHKLAMIFSIAEGNTLKVEQRHLEKANQYLLLVEKDLGYIIDNVTSKQLSTMHKREIISTIAHEKEVDRDKLYQMLYQMMSGPDFDKALNDLSKANQIVIKPKGGTTLLSLRQELTIIKKEAKGGE